MMRPHFPAALPGLGWAAPLAALLLVCLVALSFWILRRSWSARRKARPVPKEFSISTRRVLIQGVRYANPGRPPIILVHGYAGNSRHWREMGYRLFEEGFDVWMPNLRGHGRGTHRSQARDGTDYGFVSIVNDDFPVFVGHVWDQTGRAATLVGHSLGGVAARAYLSGAMLNSAGQLVISEERAAEICGPRVKNLVLIGSPVHYRNVPKPLQILIRQLPQLVEAMLVALPAPSANRAPTGPDRRGLLDRVRSQLLSTVDLTLRNANVIRGIVELENFDQRKNEFARFLEKGVSKVPLDLVRDVNAWIQHGDVVTEHGFNLSTLRRITIPILFVAGELDWLAPAADIFQEAKAYRAKGAESTVRAVLIRRTSHIDLIVGDRAARIVGGLIADFVRKPVAIGTGDEYESLE